MPDQATTLLTRLHAGVARGEPDECWPWEKGTNGHGYGSLSNWPARGRTYVHRLAWEEANGPVPDGLWVLHRCDNPPCCNPAHLFLGTPKQNSADMMTKGRSHMVGPTNPNQRLDDKTGGIMMNIPITYDTTPLYLTPEQIERLRFVVYSLERNRRQFSEDVVNETVAILRDDLPEAA